MKIGKLLSAIILTPLLVSLLLWTWMWGVFSVEYLKQEIMQYKFSAFLYKEIYDFFTVNTTQHDYSVIIDPTFIATILTLTIIIGMIGIALALVTLFVKSIYKFFLLLNKEKSVENPEEETK